MTLHLTIGVDADAPKKKADGSRAISGFKWIGECVCGATVYEMPDGKRYDATTFAEHKDWVCRRARQS